MSLIGYKRLCCENYGPEDPAILDSGPGKLETVLLLFSPVYPAILLITHVIGS